MKNMILPAKSCSIILCALLLFAAGCKKDEPVNPQQALYGDVARPTWTVQEDYDYSSSMTAVIKVETLNGQVVNARLVSESDVLAAFVGEECRGIATYDGGLFYLYIAGPHDATENDQVIRLRYWSSHYTNLFEDGAITFVNNAHIGSVAEPYVPTFVTR